MVSLSHDKASLSTLPVHHMARYEACTKVISQVYPFILSCMSPCVAGRPRHMAHGAASKGQTTHGLKKAVITNPQPRLDESSQYSRSQTIRRGQIKVTKYINFAQHGGATLRPPATMKRCAELSKFLAQSRFTMSLGFSPLGPTCMASLLNY